MTRIIRFLLFGFVSVAACKVGPDYERPAVPEHDAYRDAVPADTTAMLPADSIADLAWWDLFQDTVLQNLIRVALENNKELDIALARIAEARANLGFSRADLYPEVNVIASAAVNANTEEDVSASGLIAADAFWQVDLWGRIRRSNEAALNELLATEEAYRAVTISLVADVASFYLLLRDFDNRQTVAESTVETRRQTLDIIQARFNAGAVSEVDVNQAEIQLAEAEAAVESFRRGRAQTENAISVLLGVPPMSIPRGLALDQQILPPELPAGLPSQLVDRRPDVLQAERRLHAQTARIGVAEAIKYPSLTLSADLGASVASTSVGFLDAAADIFAPIFNAGRNQRRVEAEIARTQQALAQYEGAILTAFREVEDAMVAVRTYQTEYASRVRQLRAARSAEELSWIRYDQGMTSYLEYLEVQRQLFSSELRASETLQLRLTSLVQLYKALGGGWNPVEQVDEAEPE
jgi:multidrug efflux system outer membrane protein